MKKNINLNSYVDMKYLSNLDSYDLLNNRELMWLLSSNVEEERIIAKLLLRDRNVGTLAETFALHSN